MSRRWLTGPAWPTHRRKRAGQRLDRRRVLREQADRQRRDRKGMAR